MIIANGGRDGERLLLLGLSKRNVEQLQAERPMVLRNETHPGIEPGLVVMIPEHKQTVHASDPNITGRAPCDAPNPITSKHPTMVNCPACRRRLGVVVEQVTKARTA